MSPGSLAVAGAAACAAWAAAGGAAASWTGRHELAASARRAMHGATLWSGIVVGLLARALLQKDTTVGFVLAHLTPFLPDDVALAALVGGDAGTVAVAAACLAVAAAWPATGVREGSAADTWRVTVGGAIVASAWLAVALVGQPFRETPPWVTGPADAWRHPGALVAPTLLLVATALAVRAALLATTPALPSALARGDSRDGDAPGAWRGTALGAWVAYVTALLAIHWWAEGTADWRTDAAASAAAMAPVVPAMLVTLALAWRPKRETATAAIAMLVAGLVALPVALAVRPGLAARLADWPAWPFARWFLVLAVVALALLLVGMSGRWSRLREVPPPAGSTSAYAVLIGGAAMMLVATVATRWTRVERQLLAPGVPITVTDPFGRPWTLTGQGMSRFDVLDRRVFATAVTIARGGEPLVIGSEQRAYVQADGSPAARLATVPGVARGFLQDVRVTLSGSAPGEGVRVSVAFAPLGSWRWIGGVLLLVGGVLAWGPGRPRRLPAGVPANDLVNPGASVPVPSA